jgi:hypothetical protein
MTIIYEIQVREERGFMEFFGWRTHVATSICAGVNFKTFGKNYDDAADKFVKAYSKLCNMDDVLWVRYDI